MPLARLDEVRSIRQALGVSQSRAAALLGLSTGAVQSYEQGLRSIPPHVQRMAALLLYVKWRKRHGKSSCCWQVNRCGPDVRAACPSYQYRAGDFCWMLTGTCCRGVKQPSAAAKLAQCQQCRVMKKWLKY